MSKRSLSTGLNQSETTFGFFWWLFQLFLLGPLLRTMNDLLSGPFTETELNFTFFFLNFIAVLLIFPRFLKNSFRYTFSHPVDFFEGLVLGAVAYWLCKLAMDRFVTLLMPGFVNRNDASIASLSRGGYYLTLIGTVFLVPLAEECFYRGLLFRTGYRSSPAAGYALSAAVFAVVHVLGFGSLSPAELVLSFLQYLPAGLILAWSYVRSGTLLTPVVIHALVNYYGIRHLR